MNLCIVCLCNSVLELWTNVFSYATILIPSLLTAPRYFAGEIEFGMVTQATYAFNRIEQAVAVMIDNFQVLFTSLENTYSEGFALLNTSNC